MSAAHVGVGVRVSDPSLWTGGCYCEMVANQGDQIINREKGNFWEKNDEDFNIVPEF